MAKLEDRLERNKMGANVDNFSNSIMAIKFRDPEVDLVVAYVVFELIKQLSGNLPAVSPAEGLMGLSYSVWKRSKQIRYIERKCDMHEVRLKDGL